MPPDCILLESSSTLRKCCVRVLSEYGVESRCVEDVVAALRAVCERTPTLLISSGVLPDLPGASLVAALRESPRYRAMPIAILTCSAGLYRQNIRYEPDVLIAKDSCLETKLRAFLEELGLEQVASSANPKAAAHLLSGRRVLLAEDSRVNQLATSRILHVAGAEVVAVENGHEALEAASELLFDLILMDIEMPVMDGREATRSLRASGSTLPILAMTGHDAEEFAEEALQIGFDAVLPKVLPRGELVQTCIDYIAA